MLTGSAQHNIDEKGRIFIPAKYRAELGESFYAAKGVDECIYLYPKEQFDLKVQEYMDAGLEKRYILRDFMKNSEQLSTDKQGRVVLPKNLRDIAGIETGVLLIGMVTYIEVWSADVSETEEVSRSEYYQVELENEKRKKRGNQENEL